MNITATAGQWKLTGIAATTGSCDCCTRQIRQRVFSVAHPDGTTAQLGRRCAAKATGYRYNRLEAAERSARRVAEMRRREEIVAAAYPALGAEYAAANENARTARASGESGESIYRFFDGGCALFQTATTEDGWWGDRNRTAFESWEAYLDHYLAGV